MQPCDLLLAGATETAFSPKSDQSMEVNCEEKYHFFLFSIRKSSPIRLQNDTVLLFEQRDAHKMQRGAPPRLLSMGKPLEYEFKNKFQCLIVVADLVVKLLLSSFSLLSYRRPHLLKLPILNIK